MSLAESFLSRFFTESSATTPPLTAEQSREKQEAILQCIQGYSEEDIADEGSIDLWKLRELALSPGGLLDASIRKRAWPILTSCHMAILLDDTNTNKSQQRSVPPSQSDLLALRRDVKRTVWDITEYLQTKRLIQEVPRNSEKSLNTSTISNTGSQRDPRRVSFAMDNKVIDENEQDTIPPIQMALTDGSDDEVMDEKHSPTVATTISNNNNNLSAVSDISTSLESHGSSRSGRRVRKASKHEQKIVANIITSVLRMPAPEHASYADDRFHYYSGMQNLTALLLANLESPSLTRLVLGKLAVYHLRDAMRQETAIAEKALRLTLFPLLQLVDPLLHHHICVRAGLKESGFALSWVTAWFASDVRDLSIASRLVDVFLVSHPVMPTYCVVALLVSQRRRLLSSDPSLKSVYANLRSLNLMASLTLSDNATTNNPTMRLTEEIIASAIRYMKSYPPQSLIEASSKAFETESSLSGIAMLSKSTGPSWCTDSYCPTEWEVLKQAKAERTGDVYVEPKRSSCNVGNDVARKRYANAFAAAAQSKVQAKHSWYRQFLLLMALAAAGYHHMRAHIPFHLEADQEFTTTMSNLSNETAPIYAETSFDSDAMPELLLFSTNTSLESAIELGKQENTSIFYWMSFPEIMPHPVENPGYRLTESELDFERYILKPIHVFSQNLLQTGVKLAWTTWRRIKPSEKNTLVFLPVMNGKNAWETRAAESTSRSFKSSKDIQGHNAGAESNFHGNVRYCGKVL